MKEKVANQGITQVLRDDASPRRSELHRSKFCGEAHTALRGWRPISAALPTPVPLLFVRERKTSLINHWASRPIYNRRSIRESMWVVNSIPSKNISIRLAMPLPVDFSRPSERLCPNPYSIPLPHPVLSRPDSGNRNDKIRLFQPETILSILFSAYYKGIPLVLLPVP